MGCSCFLAKKKKNVNNNNNKDEDDKTNKKENRKKRRVKKIIENKTKEEDEDVNSGAGGDAGVDLGPEFNVDNSDVNLDIDKILNEEKEEKNNEIKGIKDEKELKTYLESLFKSYYSAKTYFCENDLKEKEVDAIHKCKAIKEAQDLLKDGKMKSIKLNEIPNKLTSKYITGYTKEERKQKLQYIIDTLSKERDYTNNLLNELLKEMQIKAQHIKKAEINTFKENSKKILDNEKNKINNIKEQIESVKKIMDDEYIPVPDYIFINEEYKKSKINEEKDDTQYRKVLVLKKFYPKFNYI